jgi:four helix bundle protein
MQDFRQLKVWEKAHYLVLDIYRITAYFPADERYGLTSQLRRAAVSIPNNVAEGCGRSTSADFARFLQISLGSASEVEYLLLLARDLSLLDGPSYAPLHNQTEEVKRMLTALTRTVRPADN